MAKGKGEATVIEAKVVEAEQKAEKLEEGIAEVQTQVTQAQEEGVPAQDLEQLKGKLESLQSQLTKAQEEAKAHQKNVSKKDSELQKLQAREARLDAIESKVGLIADGIADLMDRESSVDALEDKPQKRKSEEFRGKFEQTGQQAKQQAEQATRAQHQQVVDEVLKQLKSVGLDTTAMETEEFARAENLFLKGKAEEGLEEVKRIVMAKTEVKKVEPKESQEDLIKRIREEERKKLLIERGELDAETGQPKGATLGDKEFINQMASKASSYTKEEITRLKKLGIG